MEVALVEDRRSEIHVHLQPGRRGSRARARAPDGAPRPAGRQSQRRKERPLQRPHRPPRHGLQLPGHHRRDHARVSLLRSWVLGGHRLSRSELATPPFRGRAGDLGSRVERPGRPGGHGRPGGRRQGPPPGPAPDPAARTAADQDRAHPQHVRRGRSSGSSDRHGRAGWSPGRARVRDGRHPPGRDRGAAGGPR